MSQDNARQAGLTLEQVEMFARDMVRRGELSWCGFRKDENGHYSIPAVSPSEFKLISALLAAHSADARNVEVVWQPIETAPKDGTFIDLWIGGEFPRREPDCYWGLPDHCCGEMGSLCDSDWHGLDKGWVGSYNMPISDFDGGPTHWMPLPPPPATTAKDQS